jgi:YD repeat-containing protein
MTYDNAGRQKSIENAVGKKTTWSYDGAGCTTTIIDARGQIKSTVFDAAGQLGTILYSDGTQVTFGHDAGGRRTTKIDSTGSTTYTHDARGQTITHHRLLAIYSAPGSSVYGLDTAVCEWLDKR